MINSKTDNDIFDKVLFIGPDLRGRGGMAAVLSSYAKTMRPFHFSATNSAKGTIPGLFSLARTMMVLPFHRLCGRKIAHVHFASGKSWKRKKVVIAWARLLNFRIVMHCHSATLDKQPNLKDFAKTLKRSDVNIVLSKYWLDFFTNTLHCPNTVAINNIVVGPETAHCNQTSHNGCIKFLFLGEIGNRKGIFDIIKAIGMVRGDFKLYVGGNGETERLVKEIEDNNLTSKVELLGWVSGDIKHDLLSQCHVLMLPSYAEGLPISILEAFAYGLPVITCPVGGIPEVVQNGVNGILVSPGDVTGIANAMNTFIADRNLVNTYGQNATHAVKPFLADAVAKSLADLYRQIL